jgi:DNA-binding response OmpR family regulator
MILILDGSKRLSSKWFQVVLARTEWKVLEKFKKDTYDLCILDVMMPYKDGYTLAKIREKK